VKHAWSQCGGMHEEHATLVEWGQIRFDISRGMAIVESYNLLHDIKLIVGNL
jgi:hypothetical protein